MGRYNGNATAVHDLVRETEVHRDVYIDQEVFDLEMQHLFANTWIYVGHDSQVPNAGDYYQHDDRHSSRSSLSATPTAWCTSFTTGARTRVRASPSTPAAIPENSSAAPITPGRSRPTARCSRSRCARATRTRAWKQSHARLRGSSPVRHVKELSRLRIRQDERRRAGLRGIFRRKSFLNRQHGRSLAGWTAGSGRRRVAPHFQLQLENAGRKPDRHLPSDGRS